VVFIYLTWWENAFGFSGIYKTRYQLLSILYKKTANPNQTNHPTNQPSNKLQVKRMNAL